MVRQARKVLTSKCLMRPIGQRELQYQKTDIVAELVVHISNYAAALCILVSISQSSANLSNHGHILALLAVFKNAESMWGITCTLPASQKTQLGTTPRETAALWIKCPKAEKQKPGRSI